MHNIKSIFGTIFFLTFIGVFVSIFFYKEAVPFIAGASFMSLGLFMSMDTAGWRISSSAGKVLVIISFIVMGIISIYIGYQNYKTIQIYALELREESKNQWRATFRVPEDVSLSSERHILRFYVTYRARPASSGRITLHIRSPLERHDITGEIRGQYNSNNKLRPTTISSSLGDGYVFVPTLGQYSISAEVEKDVSVDINSIKLEIRKPR
ncbi:hypothetical protein A3H10_00505 [Candidatus Uhrbacteria bacterium RIFCSPLOWO2_12_FULL_46_10]|uniref:Uncharacterized protein n=1 Tax=Candidatus Uhrbacteria bacterium RIFCSPLOWO2_01_FULL_47_25 TaxID=1802402 RepID=A0A1F7USA5_9BACT|nr:MAG: hypothetical protein UX68_C0010G0037 [Parcubacteria group bacterium GW2011_GWA2_46_9]OGL59292.1 MAG: hypothetical protein A2752_01325 [Candidatus Uhrbacteria bacterium RIFCSPHIGHO2_01_FULL_46_23]OGL68463.1 MAG: hypothetical protein A3D60_02490 [Candidatus Uhrbacteria bacterium RIFCSPHIGHO2_02_FULL_47_29]OGL75609.1 MAG: hypothetical protein A3E96_01045 [Candidatus Uhrbacteria bacterium RIFCSPHIGHO2_12_FULL_46_13]OGL81125.1 MAG: hypothetical protein A2936_00810 [Candidatus Uhrbacteria bac